MNPVISVHSLSRRFRGHLALDDVSFDIEGPSITGLLGRNGAGKSTLMRILAAQEHQTSGKVRILGGPVWEHGAILRGIVLVREDQQYPDMKVGRIVQAASWFHPNWCDDLAAEMLREFELPLQRPVKKLSRGMRSALGIVIGIAARAEVTLLDEPYAGLDAVARRMFYDRLLGDFAVHPRTVVLSTHLIDEAADLMEHVLLVDHGRIIVDAPADDIRGGAVTVTGPSQNVDRFVADRPTWERRRLGSQKSVVMAGALDDVDGARAREMHLDLHRAVTAGDRGARRGAGPTGQQEHEGGEFRMKIWLEVCRFHVLQRMNYFVLPLVVLAFGFVVDVVIFEIDACRSQPQSLGGRPWFHMRARLGARSSERGPVASLRAFVGHYSPRFLCRHGTARRRLRCLLRIADRTRPGDRASDKRLGIQNGVLSRPIHPRRTLVPDVAHGGDRARARLHLRDMVWTCLPAVGSRWHICPRSGADLAPRHRRGARHLVKCLDELGSLFHDRQRRRNHGTSRGAGSRIGCWSYGHHPEGDGLNAGDVASQCRSPSEMKGFARSRPLYNRLELGQIRWTIRRRKASSADLSGQRGRPQLSCQGEGRGFESRLPLFHPYLLTSSTASLLPRTLLFLPSQRFGRTRRRHDVHHQHVGRRPSGAVVSRIHPIGWFLGGPDGYKNSAPPPVTMTRCA